MRIYDVTKTINEFNLKHPKPYKKLTKKLTEIEDGDSINLNELTSYRTELKYALNISKKDLTFKNGDAEVDKVFVDLDKKVLLDGYRSYVPSYFGFYGICDSEWYDKQYLSCLLLRLFDNDIFKRKKSLFFTKKETAQLLINFTFKHSSHNGPRFRKENTFVLNNFRFMLDPVIYNENIKKYDKNLVKATLFEYQKNFERINGKRHFTDFMRYGSANHINTYYDNTWFKCLMIQCYLYTLHQVITKDKEFFDQFYKYVEERYYPRNKENIIMSKHIGLTVTQDSNITGTYVDHGFMYRMINEKMTMEEVERELNVDEFQIARLSNLFEAFDSFVNESTNIDKIANKNLLTREMFDKAVNTSQFEYRFYYSSCPIKIEKNLMTNEIVDAIQEELVLVNDTFYDNLSFSAFGDSNNARIKPAKQTIRTADELHNYLSDKLELLEKVFKKVLFVDGGDEDSVYHYLIGLSMDSKKTIDRKDLKNYVKGLCTARAVTTCQMLKRSIYSYDWYNNYNWLILKYVSEIVKPVSKNLGVYKDIVGSDIEFIIKSCEERYLFNMSEKDLEELTNKVYNELNTENYLQEF